MADETQAERPMAQVHEWTDGDYAIRVMPGGGWESRREGNKHWVGHGTETWMERAAVLEILRVVAERDEARARERERVYDLAMKMAADPHAYFAIPLDASRAEYCSMALRELLRRLEQPEGEEVSSGR